MSQVVTSGTWQLKILIVDIKLETEILVNNNTQIGDLTLQLVKNVSENENHFLDHSFWWPKEKLWLKQSKCSLNQYGIGQDAVLHFTPVHKDVRVRLPNQSYRICRFNFSSEASVVLNKLCKEVNLPNAKELSFIHVPNGVQDGKIRCFNCKTNDENIKLSPKSVKYLNPSYNHALNEIDKLEETHKTCNFKDILDKDGNKSRIFIDKHWMKHSQTLMAQGVNELDLLYLTFKFNTCQYFNKCLDTTYNKFLYEYAKNQIMEYELFYSEEDAFVFAGLQLHIEKLQTIETEIKLVSKKDSIESALLELQSSLGSEEEINHDIFAVPKLSGNLLLQKELLSFRFYKSHWCEYQDFILKLYKSDLNGVRKHLNVFDLKWSEVESDISVKDNKYVINIKRKDNESTPLNIKFDNQDNFIQWWGAFKSASKGNSMASAFFKKEMESIKSYLKLQQPPQDIKLKEKLFYNILPSEYLSTYFLKGSMQSLIKKIIKAEQNIQSQSLTQARVNYIKMWQNLPSFSFDYFTVKFSEGKKKEVLGIGKDRLIKAEAGSMKIKKSWRYSSLVSWIVNWNDNSIKLQFDNEEVSFVCVISDCEIIHEFIQGYLQ